MKFPLTNIKVPDFYLLNFSSHNSFPFFSFWSQIFCFGPYLIPTHTFTHTQTNTQTHRLFNKVFLICVCVLHCIWRTTATIFFDFHCPKKITWYTITNYHFQCAMIIVCFDTEELLYVCCCTKKSVMGYISKHKFMQGS